MPSCRASGPRRPTDETGSSSTSSRTSASSSTSDPATGAAARLVGLVRLVHPFPSGLDAAITAAIAVLAGGRPATVALLAGAMLAIQAGIGATNDLVDVAADRRAKPWKPLAAGTVRRGEAIAIAGGGPLLGVVLALAVSPGPAALAAAGASTGLAYDLRLRGTALSWLPFAVGIPILPLFAWYGAAGTIPPVVGIGAALCVPAGTALAVANALPDLERDVEAGLNSVATVLGRQRAARLGAALQLVVVVAAGAAGVALGSGTVGAAAVGFVAAAVLVGLGALLSGDISVGRRQRGWELQAIGTALLGASWLGATAGAGRY